MRDDVALREEALDVLKEIATNKKANTADRVKAADAILLALDAEKSPISRSESA